MTSDVERRLEAAAEATDRVVVEWDEPGERADPMRAPRSARRRVVYPALSAAAVAAAVISVVVVTRSGNGGSPAADGSTPTAPTPTNSTVVSAPPTPGVASQQRVAARVLRQHIGGLREVLERVEADGSFSVTAQYWPGGMHLADVELDVTHGSDSTRANPCALVKGERAGHQGAPARDDVCTAHRQPDGTTVWIQKEGHSVDRPWTTADTKEWRTSQVRHNGTYVALDVTNQVGYRANGDPVYAEPAWSIPAATLIAIVTTPELTPGAGCGSHCGVLPMPPSPTVAPQSSTAPRPPTATVSPRGTVSPRATVSPRGTVSPTVTFPPSAGPTPTPTPSPPGR